MTYHYARGTAIKHPSIEREGTISLVEIWGEYWLDNVPKPAYSPMQKRGPPSLQHLLQAYNPGACEAYGQSLS